MAFYNRNLTPTTAAENFFLELMSEAQAKGTPLPVNLGLGQESQMPDDALLELITDYKLCAGEVGHHNNSEKPEARIKAQLVAASWVKRFLGVHATASNTFVLFTNGRGGLHEVFSFVALNTGASGIVLPEHHFTMYQELAAKVWRPPSLKFYPNPLSDNLCKVTRDILADSPAIKITNSPNNPTGKIPDKAWMEQLSNAMENLNGNGGDPVFHCIDLACLHAFPQRGKEEEGPYLKTHLGPVTQEKAKTPWMVVISFSKPLAVPVPGLTFLVVNPKKAEDFTSHLNGHNLLKGSPGRYGVVEKLFADNDATDRLHLSHYERLRRKYEENFAYLQEAFPGNVVHGDPCITALLAFDNLKGRSMRCGGEDLIIATTADVVKFLGEKHHVVTVDNDRHNKHVPILLRVMLAPEPKEFQEGIKRLEAGINELLSSPFPGVAIARNVIGMPFPAG